eukprot:SAG11_NODE_2125_length_3782_cov_22.707847_1_plen_133_part_00
MDKSLETKLNVTKFLKEYFADDYETMSKPHINKECCKLSKLIREYEKDSACKKCPMLRGYLMYTKMVTTSKVVESTPNQGDAEELKITKRVMPSFNEFFNKVDKKTGESMADINKDLSYDMARRQSTTTWCL